MTEDQKRQQRSWEEINASNEAYIALERKKASRLITPKHEGTEKHIVRWLRMCLWVGERPYTGKYHHVRDDDPDDGPVHPDDVECVKFWQEYLRKAEDAAMFPEPKRET